MLLENGSNHDGMRRSMIDSEHFGMRIAQLLMPITGHLLPFLAMVKQKFNAKLIFLSENEHSSLGLIASIGFLLLIFRLLAPAEKDEKSLWISIDPAQPVRGATGDDRRFRAAHRRRVAADSLLQSHEPVHRLLRAVRTCAGAAEIAGAAWSGSLKGRLAMWGVLAGLFVVGVLDHTPAQLYPVSSWWPSDRAFVAQLETELPAGRDDLSIALPRFPGGAEHGSPAALFDVADVAF